MDCECDLLARVRREIEARGLMCPGDRVLVALSGGPDSSALLHLLWRLNREENWQLQLACAHLHHGLRGEEADADLERARELASCLGIPFYSRHEDVARLARKEGLTLEAAGRLARYRFLDELADSLGFARIALGHHRDDQAETVLLHLLQGTGLRGLAGMRWIREGRYVRPLLSVSREEIEAYVASWGWQPARDRTNTDVTLLRNRLRHRLLPLLEREYNPAIRVNLARLAEVVREEDDFLEEVVRARWAAVGAEVVRVGETSRLFWTLDRYVAQPVAVQRRLLRQFVEEVTGRAAPRDLGFVQTEKWRRNLLELARKPVAFSGPFNLPGGLSYWVNRGRVGLARVERVADPEAATATPVGAAEEVPREGIILSIPGEVCWWAGAPTWLKAIPGEILPAATGTPKAEYGVLLDAGAIAGALRVRRRLPGDRIEPPGLDGSKKLQDLFVDRKIPRDWRQFWPVVVDSKGIVWVPGLAVDRRVLVKPTTSRRVYLTWSGPAWEAGGIVYN
ncbi:MAG: tRNA lysidine(34) synthetase TilS [Limnochordales bacterium]|nr:tRNA lysidine(34) synthetase TilS [Limnochordales bacterium]